MSPSYAIDPDAAAAPRAEPWRVLSFLPASHPLSAGVNRFREALAGDPEFVRLTGTGEAPGLRARFSARRRRGAWTLRHLYVSVQRLDATEVGPLARTFQWDAERGGLRVYGWDADDKLRGTGHYLADGGAGLEAEAGTLALLRYIPGQRLTFRFRNRAGRGLIGKLVARGRAARAFALLREMHAAVGDAGPPFGVAGPVALDEGRDGFFQEQLPGRPLPGLVSAENLDRWMHRVGAVHADIHRLAVPSAVPWDLAEYLGSIEERCEWVALAFPQHAALLASAKQGLWQRLPQPRQEDLVFCHSAFGCGQLLADGEALSVVDFDDASVSDQALEMARFLVLLKKHLPLLGPATGASGRRMLEQARAAYLDGYRGNGGLLPDQGRLWWYRAAWELDHLARCVTADDVTPGALDASAEALEQALETLGSLAVGGSVP